MGFVSAILNADDYTTLYSFVPTGHQSAANLSMTRDFSRRESVMSIPGMDSVLDGYGRGGGPMDRRDMSFSFRVFTADLDAAYDLLAAAIAPGSIVQLQYTTDSGTLWYTIGANPRIQQTLTSANSWGNGGYCDFTVTWRIRPDWRPRFSEVAEVFRTATSFAAGTTFGSRGVTVITANPQAFTVDARGTAGVDLPTIPDTGPTVTLTGPCGGAGGIQVINLSATVRDSTGALQPLSFTVPFALPTANDSVTLKFASQTFLHNGAAFRPTKIIDGNGLSYQREWFKVQSGVLNACQVVALGSGVVTGGNVKIDWYRKRA